MEYLSTVGSTNQHWLRQRRWRLLKSDHRRNLGTWIAASRCSINDLASAKRCWTSKLWPIACHMQMIGLIDKVSRSCLQNHSIRLVNRYGYYQWTLATWAILMDTLMEFNGHTNSTYWSYWIIGSGQMQRIPCYQGFPAWPSLQRSACWPHGTWTWGVSCTGLSSFHATNSHGSSEPIPTGSCDANCRGAGWPQKWPKVKTTMGWLGIHNPSSTMKYTPAN